MIPNNSKWGFSTAMGDGTQASGDISTTMGWNTNAQDFGTIATGIFNETDETNHLNFHTKILPL